MRYTFTAYGHKNILAAHKKTLEFTKDPEVSLEGDCIVGVAADFRLAPIKKLVKDHKHLVMTIRVGKLIETVEFVANKDFTSSREIVLRFSEFSSDRTLGFRASKSAAGLSGQMRKALAVGGRKIVVEIEPKVLAVIFDFDDTLNDLRQGIAHAHRSLAKHMFERYGVFEATTLKMLYEIDHEHSLKASGASPRYYDRHLWFELYFKRLGINVSGKEIDDAVDRYWKAILSKARSMPHAKQVLRKLSGNCLLALMTDSDGKKSIKMQRLETTGLSKYLDVVMTSDDVGQNKPNKRFYDILLKKLGVSAERCVMVGDKPQADLELAKKLGMSTVWMKYGHWADVNQGVEMGYVDHTIKDLEELPGIMRDM